MSAVWSLGAAGGGRRPCWGRCLKLWLQSSMQVQLSLIGFLLATLAFVLLGAVIKGKSSADDCFSPGSMSHWLRSCALSGAARGRPRAG